MSNRAEILSPAGSPEALRAAVANGADAVYLGYGDFNARRLAKNFTASDLDEACRFCHTRGVKVYVTVNTLANDRELSSVEKICRDINRSGADAVIVADLGIARLIREVCPELPIHASTQMTVHNLEGVKKMAELGFTRVVLARELSREEIKYICKESPIELEVFVHGALCMCYSGQCEMSAVIGKRSGNRGLCAQPCRMQYKLGERGTVAYPLSLRDLCLADYICELSEMGVASLKIEGRMKRAEYVAVVTGIYSKVLKEGRVPTDAEKRMLHEIFSRDGFTDGYYKNKKGREMFGIRTETETPRELLEAAAKTYAEVPIPTKNLDFYCIIEEGREALLAAIDENGNRAMAKGSVPERARNVALTEDTVRAQLEKTGGTRFSAREINIKLSEGLALPLSSLNAMRRECIEELERNYAIVEKKRPEGDFKVGFKLINSKEAPKYTVSVQNTAQISDELLARNPEYIYVPITEFEKNKERLAVVASKATVVAAFPRIIKDTEEKEAIRLARIARECGVEYASVGNCGHIALAEGLGFTVRGDFGINITNSHALRELRRMGATSALLSPELTFPQIRDVSKIMETEIIVYGRLPLMICENCVVSAQTGSCVCGNRQFLTDRTGAAFPLAKDFGCRTVILNSQKLFLADKKRDYERLGVSFARLSFTTENPKECIMVFDAYLGKNDFIPSVYTRGLYHRGVE